MMVSLHVIIPVCFVIVVCLRLPSSVALSGNSTCETIVIVYKNEHSNTAVARHVNLTRIQDSSASPVILTEYSVFIQNASSIIDDDTCGVISIVSCEDAAIISHITQRRDVTHIHVTMLSCNRMKKNSFTIPHLNDVMRHLVDTFVHNEGLQNALVIYDEHFENTVSGLFEDNPIPLLNLRSFDAVSPTLRHTQYTRINENKFILIANSGISHVLKKGREYKMLGIDAKWLIIAFDASLNEIQKHIRDGDNVVLVNVTSERLAVGYFSSCGADVFYLNQADMTSSVECAVRVVQRGIGETRNSSIIHGIKTDIERSVKFDVYVTDITNACEFRRETEWSHFWSHQRRLFHNFSGFHGRMFKVTALTFAPFEYKTFDDNNKVVYKGICIDMLNELAKTLNFTYEMIEPPDKKWGTELNGTWNGMIGMLARKEVFMGVGPFTISSIRSEVVDFMTPFMAGPAAMIMRRPNANNKAATYVRPFKAYVWIAIASAIVFASFFMCIFEIFSRQVLYNHSPRRPFRSCMSQCVLFIYGSIVQQGGSLNASNSPSRIFTSFWWWFAIIVIATYTGNLIAFLTVSKAELPINNLHDLVSQTEYAYGTIAGTSLHDLMMKAKDGVYKAIGDTWRANPSFFVSDDTYVSRITNDKYVFLGDKTGQELLRAADCDLVILQEEFFASYLAFPMTKANPYLSVFSKQMQHILEAGLFEIWKRNHWPRGLQCVGLKTVSESHPANMADTQGAFYVLAAGLAFAFLCFVIELLKSRLKILLNKFHQLKIFNSL